MEDFKNKKSEEKSRTKRLVLQLPLLWIENLQNERACVWCYWQEGIAGGSVAHPLNLW